MHPNFVLKFVPLLERNIIPDRSGYTNVAGDQRCAFDYDIVTIEVDDSNDVITRSSGNAITLLYLDSPPLIQMTPWSKDGKQRQKYGKKRQRGGRRHERVLQI
jgi:hypothetical protein